MTRVTRRPSPIVHPLLERISPRRSLAAAIGWTVVALFFAGAYIASLWAGRLARTRLEDQTGALYQQYALQVSNALDGNLYDRLQWLRTVADVFATRAEEEGPGLQHQLLERWRASFPELAWVGYVDGAGTLVVATGQPSEGDPLGGRHWLVEGAKREWIGEAGSIEQSRGEAAARAGGDARFIALAAPVRNADNRLIGVIGAHLSWSWVAHLEASLTEGLKSSRPVESFVVDRRGAVMIGPPALVGTTVELPDSREPGALGHLVRRWADGDEYVAGYAVSDGAGTFPGLGWTVWVREPTSTAFAAARALEQRIFAGLLLLGLVGAVFGVAATARRTRELAAIARSADEIRLGKATALVVPAGADEAARIGTSLRTLVEGLQRERSALEALNAELDARVAARTREVERMSEENKYAAVVRERLRMARDLHDTLAHSMMALLTEIRLLRKLADTDPAALRQELAHAEGAAEDGLREARAAITALRHNAVRDIGLGAALAHLMTRFRERRGLAVSFESDRGADALADSRGDALYRIAEEALRNVERHANATRVEASAKVTHRRSGSGPDEELVAVSVADDGIGFDVAAPRGAQYGLRGMREQAALIGARIEISSTPGTGTRVRVELPL